jgi:hypothetical protein
MHAVLLCEDRAGEWYDHPDFDIWADGNEWSVEAECSLLVLPLGTAPGNVKEKFRALRALKRERCWPFCGLSRRVPLAVYLVFHRWSGHGDAELDFLVFRRLLSESAADYFALSPQERITLIILR